VTFSTTGVHVSGRKSTVVDQLAAFELFDRCSRRELATIAGLYTELGLAADRAVCKQGEFGRQFFVVRDGTFEVDRDGETIAVLKAGDWFGEIALTLRCARIATVTSSTPASLLVFSPREFVSLRGACREVADAIDAAMEDRLDVLRAMSLSPAHSDTTELGGSELGRCPRETTVGARPHG
jgi:CRP-like cAMP-binding protein